MGIEGRSYVEGGGGKRERERERVRGGENIAGKVQKLFMFGLLLLSSLVLTSLLVLVHNSAVLSTCEERRGRE